MNIILIVSIVLAIINICLVFKIYCMQKKIVSYKGECDRSKYHMQIFSDWLFFIGQGGSIEKKLIEKGIKTIAIYGLSLEGYRLFEQLLASEKVELKYVIDQNHEMHSMSIPVIGMQDVERYGLADSVIIAIDCRTLKLREELKKAGFAKVFTIGELINE